MYVSSAARFCLTACQFLGFYFMIYFYTSISHLMSMFFVSILYACLILLFLLWYLYSNGKGKIRLLLLAHWTWTV